MSDLTDSLHPNPKVMLPLEMWKEWKTGCSIAGPMHDKMMHPEEPTSPAECTPCTEALISALMVRIGEYEWLLKRAKWLIENANDDMPFFATRKVWSDKYTALGLEEPNAG